METGRPFLSYISVAVFILGYEYCNARPTMDSLYGDQVYSGAIYPISGAVPKKIHSHEKKTSDDTSTSAIKEMKSETISGAVPKKIGSKNQETEEIKAQKAKKIFDRLGIDLSKIDLSQINVAHKFLGKDSLQPSLCDDTYNDRYGVGKHIVRGARDVGFAIVSGVEGVIDDLLADIPLVPNITSGIGGGLKAIICAIENGFSDIANDLDSGIDIAKNGLVDFFKLKGPHPVLDVPVGIAGIAREAVNGAGQLVGDTVGGVKNAVGEILDAL